MKKRLLIIAAFLAVFGGAAATTAVTNAEPAFVSSDDGTVTLAKDKIHDGSYYAGGQDIVINGTIKGDLYCAGQTVQINGTVDGDVICAAQDIKVSGTVGQDVRAAGQFVAVSGKVGGNVTGFAQKVEIAKSAAVAKDVNGAAQDFVIDGTVGRDLAIGTEKLAIAGLVEGDARVAANDFALTSEPAIKGSLEYDNESKQEIPANAVGGETKFNKVESSDGDETSAGAAIAQFYLFVALAFVVLSIVVALIAPRFLERSNRLARQKLGQIVLVGIAVSLGAPILGILLAITGVGLPLALLVFAGLLIINILAFPFAAYYLSRALFGQVVHNVVLLMLAGAVLIAILMAIPILNILAYFVVLIIGVGGLFSTIVNGYQKPEYSILKKATKRKK